MKRLTFKVSAKTARLIGRENISNAEGAIGELIKNTYDADAEWCVIYFNCKYSDTPKQLASAEFQWLSAKNFGVENFYEFNQTENSYKLKENLADEEISKATQIASNILDLWIIDNGSGMNAHTIEDHWMVIGTSNKEANYHSPRGRIMTGEKGIGRFALDRLGSTSQIISTVKAATGDSNSIIWDVDWSSFDSKGKVLEDITAELRELDNSGPLVYEKVKDLGIHESTAKIMDTEGLEVKDWSTGTAIRIGSLRDNWSKSEINRLFYSLSALIPPVELQELNLFLLHDNYPNSYGLVASAALRDFDYRIDAEMSESNNAEFRIIRNELNHGELNADLFEREDMKKFPFDTDSFNNRELSYTKSLKKLFPGESEEFIAAINKIGSFKVSMMFFKRGRPNKSDQKKYPYRSFQPEPRKKWLEKFGGIKIYRDNFLVRPYGEVNSKSFDWLTLGQRVALNPAAAARRGWKVSPQNIAGTIQISRSSNLQLADQANREGIIENKTFFLFKKLVIRIIKEFEDDRSHILFNLNELYKEQNKSEQIKLKGENAANKVKSTPEIATSEDVLALANSVIVQKEEIEELYDEQAILRSLATLGTVLVSFSHEMAQLQYNMGSRILDLARILKNQIPQLECDLGDPFNPYSILQELKEDDQKAKHWFKFALSPIHPNRRRKQTIAIKQHLESIKKNWNGFLKPRSVELLIKIPDDTNLKILAFAIDLDSIFNNLILNSVEALLSNRHAGERRIEINVSATEEKVAIIEYTDNGPGLHESIDNPRDIFNFNFTTKFDGDGNKIGTGLGMWILDSIVNEYGGSVQAFRPSKDYGFRLKLQLPRK